MNISNDIKKKVSDLGFSMGLTNEQNVDFVVTFDYGFFDELPPAIYSKIWQFLDCDYEMPYGTQKCRTGEPEDWIREALEELVY